MKINEVEQLLNISRANIRFYEKEGLLNPSRNENKYREYNEEDIALLKKIIIYRKIGLRIDEIKNILNNSISLQETIQQNIVRLNKQMEDVKGSLDVCERIQIENKEDIDTQHYYEYMQNKEKQGIGFVSIVKDYMELEKQSFLSLWKTVFFVDMEKYINKKGCIFAFLIVCILCCIRGLATQFLWKSGTFLSGFLYPFLLFLIVSVLTLPLYILNRKYENIEKTDESKLTNLPFLIKCLFVVVYMCILLVGIPIFLERFYFDQIYGYVNYIVTCDTFYIYFICGLYVLFIFIWFYSINGLYGYFKPNLPHSIKRKIILLATIPFLLSILSMTMHYNCISKNDIYEKTVFNTKHYDLNKDFKEVELKANSDGTLRIDIYVYKHAQKRKKFNILGGNIVLSNLHKLEYPNGVEDFSYRVLFLRGIKDLTDYDTLYENLTYDYWKEYAKKVENLLN